MRTLLTVPLAALLLGSMMLAGGCVSQSKYDEALAAGRRAQDQLLATQEALHKLTGERDQLLKELESLREAMSKDGGSKEALLAEIAKLQKEIDRLNKMIADLSNRAPEAIPTASVLPPDMDKFLKELAEKYPDLFKYYPDKGMLKLASDMTFKKGSDVVNDRAKEALRKFVEVFNIPQAAKYHVYIAGHTDDIRISPTGETRKRHPDNWYLSVHRAVAVEQELVADSFPPSRIGAMGFGEYHPAVPNAPGNQGAEPNRRVEIWILPPSRFLTMENQIESSAPVAPKAKAKPKAKAVTPTTTPVEELRD